MCAPNVLAVQCQCGGVQPMFQLAIHTSCVNSVQPLNTDSTICHFSVSMHKAWLSSHQIASSSSMEIIPQVKFLCVDCKRGVSLFPYQLVHLLAGPPVDPRCTYIQKQVCAHQCKSCYNNIIQTRKQNLCKKVYLNPKKHTHRNYLGPWNLFAIINKWQTWTETIVKNNQISKDCRHCFLWQ